MTTPARATDGQTTLPGIPLADDPATAARADAVEDFLDAPRRPSPPVPSAARRRAPRRRRRAPRARRIACLELPELPLQILLRDHPRWRGHPVALVPEDTPQAPIIRVNRAARKLRLRTGMRYGAARSLVPELRAGVVSPERVDAVVDELTRALQTFSPNVEVARDRPGVFYIDPDGLGGLYGDDATWARSVHKYLEGRGFLASLVVGFDRGLVHALAQHRYAAVCREPLVTGDANDERDRAAAIPLGHLDLDPDLRDGLEALGVRTLGAMMALPGAELADRFGPPAAAAVTRFGALAPVGGRAEDRATLPVQGQRVVDPVTASTEIHPPDRDQARLLFAIKGVLDDALRQSVARGEAVRALRLELALERYGPAREDPVVATRLEPARPTCDPKILLELLRLRLGELSLPTPVESLTVTVDGAAADRDQLGLFPGASRRDPAAGDRALARVRALFGEDTVVRPVLRPAHLPEARFSWEQLRALPRETLTPSANQNGNGTGAFRPRVVRDGDLPNAALVRRLYARPKPLATRTGGAATDPRQGTLFHLPGSADDGGGDDAAPDRSGANVVPGPAFPDHLETADGRRLRLVGPHRVSGGWWVREVARDYAYAETDGGDLLWVYFDRKRRRWFVHGEVD